MSDLVDELLNFFDDQPIDPRKGPRADEEIHISKCDIQDVMWRAADHIEQLEARVKELEEYIHTRLHGEPPEQD